MKLTCPSCNHEFERCAVGVMSDDQKLEMVIKSESALFGAQEAAEALLALTKTLKATAKSIDEKCEVYLTTAVVEEHEMRFGVAVVPVEKRK